MVQRASERGARGGVVPLAPLPGAAHDERRRTRRLLARVARLLEPPADKAAQLAHLVRRVQPVGGAKGEDLLRRVLPLVHPQSDHLLPASLAALAAPRQRQRHLHQRLRSCLAALAALALCRTSRVHPELRGGEHLGQKGGPIRLRLRGARPRLHQRRRLLGRARRRRRLLRRLLLLLLPLLRKQPHRRAKLRLQAGHDVGLEPWPHQRACQVLGRLVMHALLGQRLGPLLVRAGRPQPQLLWRLVGGALHLSDQVLRDLEHAVDVERVLLREGDGRGGGVLATPHHALVATRTAARGEREG
mmetsp:Transcript_16600/g.53791  ORF Transcript_16600/g.53791 Transcript_16600/m.53791 type:complete len:302 (-) Transcript_16600:226-1131(-)